MGDSRYERRDPADLRPIIDTGRNKDRRQSLHGDPAARVRVERMVDAPAAFAAQADPDGETLLALAAGNAGWHRAHALVVPPNARLHFLPPCTPRLQPAEHP